MMSPTSHMLIYRLATDKRDIGLRDRYCGGHADGREYTVNEWNEDADRARQRLRNDFAELEDCVARLQRFTAAYEQEPQDEPMRELTEFARSEGAPPELRRVQEQVDRGQVSWTRVLDGEAGGLIDRRAGALIAERLADLATVAQAVRAGVPSDEAAARVEEARRRATDGRDREPT
jgi:hypothetical protein